MFVLCFLNEINTTTPCIRMTIYRNNFKKKTKIYIPMFLILQIIPGLSTTDNDLNPTVKYSLQTHEDKFDIDSIKGMS